MSNNSASRSWVRRHSGDWGGVVSINRVAISLPEEIQGLVRCLFFTYIFYDQPFKFYVIEFGEFGNSCHCELTYNHKSKLIKLKHPKPPMYTKPGVLKIKNMYLSLKGTAAHSVQVWVSVSANRWFHNPYSNSVSTKKFEPLVQILRNLAYNLDLNLLNSEWSTLIQGSWQLRKSVGDRQTGQHCRVVHGDACSQLWSVGASK
jgi:hypothetical protein